MTEIDLGNTWWFTIGAAVIFSVTSLYLLRQWFKARFSPGYQLLVLVNLLIILLTPVAVPDTQYLAPAWFASLFEWVFGSPDIAAKALRVVVVFLLVFNLLYALFALLLHLIRRRRTVSSPS